MNPLNFFLTPQQQAQVRDDQYFPSNPLNPVAGMNISWPNNRGQIASLDSPVKMVSVKVISKYGFTTDSNGYYYAELYDAWFGVPGGLTCEVRLEAVGPTLYDGDVVMAQFKGITGGVAPDAGRNLLIPVGAPTNVPPSNNCCCDCAVGDPCGAIAGPQTLIVDYEGRVIGGYGAQSGAQSLTWFSPYEYSDPTGLVWSGNNNIAPGGGYTAFDTIVVDDCGKVLGAFSSSDGSWFTSCRCPNPGAQWRNINGAGPQGPQGAVERCDCNGPVFQSLKNLSTIVTDSCGHVVGGYTYTEGPQGPQGVQWYSPYGATSPDPSLANTNESCVD